jgi:hypothetical protein
MQVNHLTGLVCISACSGRLAGDLLPSDSRRSQKEVSLMTITITKVETIEATRIHTDPGQVA